MAMMDSSNINTAGSIKNLPPFLSSNTPKNGEAMAWAMLAGIKIKPVAVAVSPSTCCVYIGIKISTPINRK